MTKQPIKIVRSVLAVCASLWMAVSSSIAFADGFVIANDPIQTITGTPLVIYVINGSFSKQVYTAKVITENLSSGTRSVQCTLNIGQTWFDFANATMGPGEMQTMTLIGQKPTTNSQVGGNVSCRVFSAQTSGVTVSSFRIHIESGT